MLRREINKLYYFFLSAIGRGQLKNVFFENRSLIPHEWLEDGLDPEMFRVFNPTIMDVQDRYVLCYRVVDPAGNLRRLATCQLDREFSPIAGTVTALSDIIEFAAPDVLNERARTWHADPRLFKLFGKIFVSWNDGNNKPTNNQFLLELTPDGLRPAGKAREIIVKPRRHRIEKNWAFVEHEGSIWCIYSMSPLIVAQVDMSGESQIVCDRVTQLGWGNSYEGGFGQIRNGGQPSLVDGKFLAICHSSHKGLNGRVYEVCATEISASPDFAVETYTKRPIRVLDHARSSFKMEKLNPNVASVVYPSGNLVEGQRLVISYGINDERAAVSIMPLSYVYRQFKVPVTGNIAAEVQSELKKDLPAIGEQSNSRRVSLFWWQSLGKKFDGPEGDRKFKIGNFGDIASRDLVDKLAPYKTRTAEVKERKMLAVGSVLHLARNGDVVWGSGFKGTKLALTEGVHDIDVRAVRGPKTLEVLRSHNIDVSKVTRFFDPGCLMPYLFKDEIADIRKKKSYVVRDVCIIPHYRDDLLLHRKYPDLSSRMVSVDCTPMDMIQNIIGAQRVISSSLHGIIFAEALGIPAQWLQETGGEDDFKYFDYYFGTDRFEVKKFENLRKAMAGSPMQLPKFDFEAIAATFPHDVIGHYAGTGFPVDAPVVTKLKHLDVFSGWVTSSSPLKHTKKGAWLTEANGAVRLELTAGAPALESVKLKIRPFNPSMLSGSQECTVFVEGAKPVKISWMPGRSKSVETVIPVPELHDRESITLIFDAKHKSSPRQLLGVPIGGEVSVCIEEIELLSARQHGARAN